MTNFANCSGRSKCRGRDRRLGKSVGLVVANNGLCTSSIFHLQRYFLALWRDQIELEFPG
jgi:hypothetical protein